MRNDDLPRDGIEPPDRPDGEPAATPPRAQPERRLVRAKVPALVILMAGTCWVVATLVSPWLVPPYLVAMALILLPAAEAPRARSSGRPDRPAAESATAPGRDHPSGGPGGAVASAARATSGPDSGRPGGDSPLGDGPDPVPGGADAGAAVATAAKPKKSRGRTRKPSKPVAEPVEVVQATWIEIGPGKFVRAEAPAPSDAVAGPHAPVEPRPELPPVEDAGAPASEPHAGAEIVAEPVGSPATVAPAPPPEPIAEAPIEPTEPDPGIVPDVAELAALADPGVAPRPTHAAPEPLAAEMPVPPVAPAVDADSSPEPSPHAPTVDGIAPQVEGWAGSDFEPDPLDAPDAAPVEPLDARDEPETAPEPAGSADPAESDVAWAIGSSPECPPWSVEYADEAVEFDPEEPVEVDFDEAEASLSDEQPGARAELLEMSDESEEAIPADSDVSGEFEDDTRADRPGGLGAWFCRRSGRASSRRVPPGRSGRPPRSPRRPAKSQRPQGRRRGRSSRIARAFPPRSPPRPGFGR